jgi:uncharacterized protein with HEPN domain
MPRDALLLTEIIDAGERIVASVGRLDPDDLTQDRDRLDALLWNYTVLGEAAGQASPRPRPPTRRCHGPTLFA